MISSVRFRVTDLLQIYIRVHRDKVGLFFFQISNIGKIQYFIYKKKDFTFKTRFFDIQKLCFLENVFNVLISEKLLEIFTSKSLYSPDFYVVHSFRLHSNILLLK